jgi:hypothetical protein
MRALTDLHLLADNKLCLTDILGDTKNRFIHNLSPTAG